MLSTGNAVPLSSHHRQRLLDYEKSQSGLEESKGLSD